MQKHLNLAENNPKWQLCKEPMAAAMAAWTEVGISIFGGFALVLIADLTSSEYSSLRKFWQTVAARYFT